MQNKIKGFNTTDINKEFCLIYGEVSEAYDAKKNKDDLGEELADIAIYLFLRLSNIRQKFRRRIINKIEINKNRKYKKSEWNNDKNKRLITNWR